MLLLGDIARLGEAGLADHRVEAGAVELPGDAAEYRIVANALGDDLVGQVQSEPAHFFVDGGLGQQLSEQRTMQPERARLIGRYRPAQLTDQLLQTVIVLLTELLDADLGAADLGQRRGSEALENIADAPDRERDRDQAEQDAGDQSAEPVFGSVLQSA